MRGVRDDDICALIDIIEDLAIGYAGEYGHDDGAPDEVWWALDDDSGDTPYDRIREACRRQRDGPDPHTLSPTDFHVR